MRSLLTLDGVVDELAEHGDLGDQIVHRAYLPPRPETLASPNPPLDTGLRAALTLAGVGELWHHQARGIEAARANRDVLITTPTASGKSLVFQVPVIEEALRRGPGRAVFLFPLKALGQDQKGKLDQISSSLGLDPSEMSAIYDGDTPRKQRERIRESPPRILISNPDMLHLGILAHAASWGPFLRDLRWIVLDELHTYRGIFGGHFHHVLQRLLRLCQRAGSSPSIVASSATATNAADFAAALAARPFEIIEESGAPREGRHFLLMQPQTSPYTTTLQLLVELVGAGLKTIVFTKARRITELLQKWLHDKEPRLAERIANYRAGFLASERRRIEQELFDGRLDAVISTSALEMGIDVGGLDACILVGFPGSMMATWQRSGRVGRKDRESITALVALPDALDQYLLRNPDDFLDRQCEPLVISPGAPAIAGPHLQCAAAELPLDDTKDASYLERNRALVGDLISSFDLTRSEDGREIYCRHQSPHRGVSLRGGGHTYGIESEATGKIIGTVDGVRVLRECHPGAIYLHAGRQLAVTELNSERKRVQARPVRVDYFTSPLTEKNTQILEILGERSDGPLHAWLGRVKVTEWVVGFERRRIASQEKLGEEDLELDPVEFESVALWFAAPRTIEETLRDEDQDFMGALHAAEHAAISLFPVLALCDRGDLGGISIPHHPQVGCGAVFIYDGHEGGVGIADAGFERLPELLDRVVELLRGCSCESGCPGCVQSPKCGNGNRPLDKAGAEHLIEILRERRPANHGEITVPALDLSQPVERHSRRKRRTLPGEPAREGNGPTDALITSDPQPLGGSRRSLFDLGHSHAEVRRQQRAWKRPIIPAIIENTVLFDIETKRSADDVGGWHRLHRLGMALAVALHLEENRFVVYHEQDAAKLGEDLRSADLVVGFNIYRFDYAVLAGYTGEDYRRTLPTLDLFEQVADTVGSKLSLNKLARATLGISKSADGLQSLEWYKEGRLDLIEEYCHQDVVVLRDLYLFGRREGYVCTEDREGRIIQIPVDW